MSRESKILVGILSVVVVGLVGLFVFANGGSDTKVTGSKDTIIRPDSHKQGTGSVQLVEYGDYQCPSCGAAYPVLKQIMKEYDGKVTFYFRNFPIPTLHPNAIAAANAAEAAADQGKFWEMHDKLYEKQAEWSDLAANDALTKFAEYANSLGIDGNKVKQAAADQTYKTRIDQDTADGTAQGVSGTPTIFVNSQPLQHNDYPTIRDAIEKALKG